MDNIILNDIVINKNIVFYHFKVTGETSSFFRSDTMFFEFPCDVSNIPQSILVLPFVASIYSLTWFNNSILWVPEIDRTFLMSLREVKQSFQEMHYDFQFRGKIVPSKIIDNHIEQSDDAILLFGGGVDAHCSFIRNKTVISRIVNVQGWFESLDAVDKGADDDYRHCKLFAESQNIVFLYVRSNFATMINSSKIDHLYSKRLRESWWHGFQHSQAFISTAMVLAFKYGVSNIYIASSNTTGDQVACASDVTTDSMFSFAENGRVVHDAFELNRQEKIKIIVDYQKKTGKPYPLKVCSFNDHNCCECEKCFRTIIEIVAENGDVNAFGFDVPTSLKNYYQDVVYRRIGLWGIGFESKIYWTKTRERMLENYDQIKDKEFVDWFLNFDFVKAHRQGLLRYYRQNFFSILKRKLNLKK